MSAFYGSTYRMLPAKTHVCTDNLDHITTIASCFGGGSQKLQMQTLRRTPFWLICAPDGVTDRQHALALRDNVQKRALMAYDSVPDSSRTSVQVYLLPATRGRRR